MPALFLILDRNREWWGSKGPPASGARVRFAPSEIIFQYYPGRGLQLQPLANFGFANGLWYSNRDDRLRSADRRVRPAAGEQGRRSAPGSTTSTSGEARRRGSRGWRRQPRCRRSRGRAHDSATRSLLQIASEGVAAFERSTPTGVRVAAADGAWYALYSFAPRLEVLNGMLQSLIGLDAYRTLTGDPRGTALFDAGDALARARIGSYDTGAWSLYSRSSGRDGAEADLNYHKLNRDFARRLCRHHRRRALLLCRGQLQRLPEGGSAARPVRARSRAGARRAWRALPLHAVEGRPCRHHGERRRRRAHVPVDQRPLLARKALLPLGAATLPARADLRVQPVRARPGRQHHTARAESA